MVVMRIPDALVLKLVSTTRKLSDAQVAELRAQETATHTPMQDIVINSGIISESELTRLYARHIGIPYIDLSLVEIEPSLLKKLPERIARRYGLILFGLHTDGYYDAAIIDKLNDPSLKDIEKHVGRPIRLHLAPQSSIERVLGQYRMLEPRIGPLVSLQRASDGARKAHSGEELVTELLRQALDLNVSDIHVEPHEHHAQLRFRIDGRLQSFHPLSLSQYAALSSFLIHDLANMNQGDTQNPKEGSFRHTQNNAEYRITLSVLPVVDGQKINLHIQARSTSAPNLDSLGLWGPALTRTKQALTNTNGLILVSGPGKSGKTATLHALLKTVHSTHVSMVAIEEESPYSEPYITHVRIDSKNGGSWDKALAAGLKQDPDIVSIQRIQDARTAKRAVEAAEHRQLIFGGIVASSASLTINKLKGLSVATHDIASAVRCIIGQRLVRTVCQHCKITVAADASVIKRVGDILAHVPQYSPSDIHQIEKAAVAMGLGEDSKLSTTSKKIHSVWEYNPEGCEHCHGTGYKGLTGIFEVMQVSDTIKSDIMKDVSDKDILDHAIEEGMIPFVIDGLVKVLRGITTLEEIERVLQSTY